ncbi:hypothetical protein J4476_06250 [Candidatus Woesearchaeota archaeon]|nr:MAG: hypothetical protein QT09_C0014G0029 [archaeon GW2011_AR18]MBS3162270.1 hypothetical protein [Candidatus Woesearchaeota archaeon]HIH25168.1 hypothetical protein [Nanoarchaeota archaeon]
MDVNIKKNILDLEYNKNLQHHNTIIVIISTYLIAIILALITKQIDYTSLKEFSILGVVTSLVIILNISLLIKFRERLKNIIEEIKNL